MFKKHMHGSGAKVVHKGKGATEELLPSRSALTKLTAGDPAQRTLQNYAKATPAPLDTAETPFTDPMGG